MTKDEKTYTVETLKVADLLVDQRIQRDNLQDNKVAAIVKNFNPDALGVAHVSRRRTPNGDLVGDYVLDGWHRKEVVHRVTEGAGTLVCHVYEGLTLAEEAELFLQLNNANQPSPLEKHKARVVTGDPQATRVEEAVHRYGWTISRSPLGGHVPAVQKLYRIDDMNQANLDRELDLLANTFLVITRAWGNDKYGAQAMVLEAVARMILEHGFAAADGRATSSGRIDLERLIDRMKNYKGGPKRLRTEASQFASNTGMRVSMSVAFLLTEAYNKGYPDASKRSLPTWTKRV